MTPFRYQKIRSDLRRLTPEERFIVYSQAADPLVIDAIESAPPTIRRAGKNGPKGVRLQPFIDSESRAATALERARAENPEKAEELESLRDLEQIYEMSLNGVRAGILEELPAAMEIRTEAEV